MKNMPRQAMGFVSSGNIWADLGRPDAEQLLMRAELMRRVTRYIRDAGHSNRTAAQILGTSPDAVSAMLAGEFSEFSLDQLLGYARTLGLASDIEDEVTPAPHKENTPTRAE